MIRAHLFSPTIRLSARPRCSSGRQPDVSLVSGERARAREHQRRSSRPLAGPAPFCADILCPQSFISLILLPPTFARTIGRRTLVIGQQIREWNSIIRKPKETPPRPETHAKPFPPRFSHFYLSFLRI